MSADTQRVLTPLDWRESWEGGLRVGGGCRERTEPLRQGASLREGIFIRRSSS